MFEHTAAVKNTHDTAAMDAGVSHASGCVALAKSMPEAATPQKNVQPQQTAPVEEKSGKNSGITSAVKSATEHAAVRTGTSNCPNCPEAIKFAYCANTKLNKHNRRTARCTIIRCTRTITIKCNINTYYIERLASNTSRGIEQNPTFSSPRRQRQTQRARRK